MKSYVSLALAASIVCGTATLVQASHANPWATADDTVLSQYHDDNQAHRTDTSGEDGMHGAMERKAVGKTTGKASGNSGQAPEGGRGGQRGKR